MSNLTWRACSVCAARVARLVEKGRGFGRHSSCEESSDYLPWRRACVPQRLSCQRWDLSRYTEASDFDFGCESDFVVLRSTRFLRIMRRRTHAEPLNLGCNSGEPPYRQSSSFDSRLRLRPFASGDPSCPMRAINAPGTSERAAKKKKQCCELRASDRGCQLELSSEARHRSA